MLAVDSARKRGINACIDKLGRDFVMAHKDTSSSAWGETENIVYCFVGVGEELPDTHPGLIVLDSTSKFPYRASCNVDRESGNLDFIECIVP